MRRSMFASAPLVLSVGILFVAAAQPAQATHEAKEVHHIAIQVDVNDPATMNLALNNAVNVSEYYSGIGEEVEIEIVTYGPGLHMLRDDTSPVKERIKSIGESIPGIHFSACGNTIDAMQRNEKRDVELVPQATVVQAGVVRLMELQEQGWTYIRP